MSVPTLIAVALTEADRLAGERLLGDVPGWTGTGIGLWPETAGDPAAGGVALLGTDPATLPVVVRALRQKWRALPLVVLGPVAESDLEAACLEAGADECCASAAISPPQVAAALRRALARRQACMATTTLAAALESPFEAIWSVDHQYRFQLFNAFFVERLAGVYGITVRPGDSALAGVPPEVATIWQGWYDRALAGERFTVQIHPEFSGVVRTVDVHLCPLSVNGAIIGARCASRDITDRVAAEVARLDLEQNLQAIIDGSSDSVFSVDRELRLTSFNRAFADGFWLMMNRRPVLGESSLSPATEEQSRLFRAAYETALGGEAVAMDFAFGTGGQDFVFDISMTPIRTSDGVTGVWCVWKDITARKAHEESLRRAKEAAEAATRAKSEFLAIMSHEIRTPLHAVLGLTDLLLETSLSADQRDYAESLRQSAGTLSTILDDILDFSKLEAGKLALHLEPLEFDALVTEVVEPMAVRAFEKGLDFLLHLDPGLPHEVVVDGNRLRQVLLNLLGNALKFTDTGCIGLEVHCRCQEADDRCRLEVIVWDTGIGIPADKQANLFQHFSQADTSTTRRFGGTGLGLAISQEILQLMGSDIRLESAEGTGSTFRFCLDVPIVATETALSPQPRGRRLLAILRHDARRQALEAYARHWGADLQVLPSVAAATAWLTQTDWRPDLVLVGWQAHVANDRDPAGPAPDGWGAPAVLMLPVRLRRHRRRKLAKGYSDCILDPATPNLLGQRLEAVIANPARTLHQAERSFAAPAPVVHAARVLVVDDNAINLKMASRMLERLGYQVVTAMSGSEAVARVGRSRFDLIFMDCQMPETDGYQATRAIRQLPEGRHVPIIAITASALPGDRERCLQAGMNDYLSKPVQREALQGMLERWLPGAEATENPAIVDRDELMTLVDGDAALLRELVASYLAEAPQMQGNLQRASSQGDALALARAAHTLKGALLNLAAGPPAALALSIEVAARQGETARAAHLLPELDDLLAQLPVCLEGLMT